MMILNTIVPRFRPLADGMGVRSIDVYQRDLAGSLHLLQEGLEQDVALGQEFGDVIQHFGVVSRTAESADRADADCRFGNHLAAGELCKEGRNTWLVRLTSALW